MTAEVINREYSDDWKTEREMIAALFAVVILMLLLDIAIKIYLSL